MSVDLDKNGSSVAGDGESLPEIIHETREVDISDIVTAPTAPATVILNRDGTVKRKPGRKPGQKNSLTSAVASDSDAQATVSTPATKKAVRLGCDQTARALLNTTVGVMREVIGDEWDFESEEEATGMRIALAAYIESKGAGEMSPEIALLLVTCGYALPRFTHDNTRSKFKSFLSTCLNAVRSIFHV